MAKETYTYGKRDLHTRQKRLTKEATYTAKESERVRHQRTRRHQCSPRQKRPTHTAKEAYAHCKRGLRTRQKRPTHTAKEAYAHCKRGPRTRHKRLHKRGYIYGKGDGASETSTHSPATMLATASRFWAAIFSRSFAPPQGRPPLVRNARTYISASRSSRKDCASPESLEFSLGLART